jgi:hypothetical protein
MPLLDALGRVGERVGTRQQARTGGSAGLLQAFLDPQSAERPDDASDAAGPLTVLRLARVVTTVVDVSLVSDPLPAAGFGGGVPGALVVLQDIRRVGQPAKRLISGLRLLTHLIPPENVLHRMVMSDGVGRFTVRLG